MVWVQNLLFVGEFFTVAGSLVLEKVSTKSGVLHVVTDDIRVQQASYVKML